MNLPLLPISYHVQLTSNKELDEIHAKFEKETKKLKYHSYYRAGNKLVLEEQIMNKGGKIAEISWECIPLTEKSGLVFDSVVQLRYGSSLVAATVFPAIISGIIFMILFLQTFSPIAFVLLGMYSFWYLLIVLIVRFNVNSFIEDLKYIMK